MGMSGEVRSRGGGCRGSGAGRKETRRWTCVRADLGEVSGDSLLRMGVAKGGGKRVIDGDTHR